MPRIAFNADGEPEVDGEVRPGLRPNASTSLAGRPLLSLATLNVSTEADARQLGADLWRSLGVPVPAGPLDLVVDDPQLASLPWHWLTIDGRPLADDVRIRVQVSQLAPAPWSLSPAALILEPDSATTTGLLVWRAALPGVDVRAEYDVERWLAALGGQDVAWLVVNGATDKVLDLGEGRTLRVDALRTALRHQGPRLLVLESSRRIDRVAAELAGDCRALAVLLRTGDDPVGPSLGAALWKDNLPLDEALHVLGRMLPLHQQPRAFGGTERPKPAGGELESDWYLSREWRVRLDRRKQTHEVMGEIEQLGQQLPAFPGQHPGLIVVWHGPPERDLGRFRLRILHELARKEVPHGELNLKWPVRLTDLELRAVVSAALPREYASDVQAGLAERVAVGAASAGVLLACFEIVGAQVRDAGRLLPDNVTALLAAWRNLVQVLPERVLPVLGLPIQRGPNTSELIARLAESAKRPPATLRPQTLLVLDELPDVVPNDIVTLIREEKLIADPQTWNDVAEEIVARTNGAYDRVIRMVETLRWDHGALYNSWQNRKTPR